MVYFTGNHHVPNFYTCDAICYADAENTLRFIEIDCTFGFNGNINATLAHFDDDYSESTLRRQKSTLFVNCPAVMNFFFQSI